MKFLEGSSLSRVRQKDCARLDRHYVQQDNGLWTESEEAGAVAIYPVSNSPIEGKVNFLFKETMPVEGVKGPDNPSTIIGRSNVSVTRCEKNLVELNRVYAIPDRGVTATVNTDGSVHVEGESGNYPPLIDFGNHDNSVNKQLPYWMEVGKTYTLSFNSSNTNGNPRASLYLSNSLTAWGIESTVYPGESYTFTVDNDKRRALIRIAFNRNSTINCDCYLQIEEGSSATSFNGIIPNNYPISLDSIYYGGSIDLATGVMTVTHWGFALDGTEQWRAVGTVGSDFRHDLTNSAYPTLKKISGLATCSHFSTATSGDLRMYISAVLGGTTWFLVCVDTNAAYPTTDAWKSFLASQYANGTPVTLAYKLATPYTVQLSPVQISALIQSDKYTPRLNTIYSDAESVQIRYKKSPMREAYEQRQAIASIGGV